MSLSQVSSLGLSDPSRVETASPLGAHCCSNYTSSLATAELLKVPQVLQDYGSRQTVLEFGRTAPGGSGHLVLAGLATISSDV